MGSGFFQTFFVLLLLNKGVNYGNKKKADRAHIDKIMSLYKEAKRYSWIIMAIKIIGL